MAFVFDINELDLGELEDFAEATGIDPMQLQDGWQPTLKAVRAPDRLVEFLALIRAFWIGYRESVSFHPHAELERRIQFTPRPHDLGEQAAALAGLILDDGHERDPVLILHARRRRAPHDVEHRRMDVDRVSEVRRLATRIDDERAVDHERHLRAAAVDVALAVQESRGQGVDDRAVVAAHDHHRFQELGG